MKMANYKIKLEDDTLLDYEAEGGLEEALAAIFKAEDFILCKDYKGKSYGVHKRFIKVVYPEVE